MIAARSEWPRWARVATSPWVVSPIVVLGLLVSAVAGYGAYTRSRPTNYARGGIFAPIPSQTPSGPGLAVVPSSAPTSVASVAASGSPSTTSTPPSERDHTAAAGSTVGGTSAGGHVAPSVSTPAVGTYTLAVDGSEHVEFGPFSACTNTFPTQSQLVVSRATGEPGTSFNFDQRLYPGTPSKHDERHIYRYTSGSMLLSYEEATVTCAGIKQSTTVNYDPAQIRVELPLRVGAQWHSRGGDSTRTEDATGKVTGTDHVTISGHSYLTYVIDTTVSMTGSESGSRQQRWWWSPELGMPVKWHESLSGSRSGASYSENATYTVTRVPCPAPAPPPSPPQARARPADHAQIALQTRVLRAISA